jgi:hypothetical protein
MARIVVATDIGGTFTDLVALDDSGRLAIHKVLSTPANYADGLLVGVSELAAARRWTLEAIFGPKPPRHSSTLQQSGRYPESVERRPPARRRQTL